MAKERGSNPCGFDPPLVRWEELLLQSYKATAVACILVGIGTPGLAVGLATLVTELAAAGLVATAVGLLVGRRVLRGLLVSEDGTGASRIT